MESFRLTIFFLSRGERKPFDIDCCSQCVLEDSVIEEAFFSSFLI